MKFITIGGAPGAGKTYTSKLLAKEYDFLSLEFESLRWDFFNDNIDKNLYEYTQYVFPLENENMRDYYLRCTLFDNKIPLELFIKWHKATMKFIQRKLCQIVYELKEVKTKEEYLNFFDKYKRLINYMPKFEKLNMEYIICSHAFINTIDFPRNQRIQIDFVMDKGILIGRFKQRENITESSFDKNIELYYQSYEEVLKDSVASKLDSNNKDIIEKIYNLIQNN